MKVERRSSKKNARMGKDRSRYSYTPSHCQNWNCSLERKGAACRKQFFVFVPCPTEKNTLCPPQFGFFFFSFFTVMFCLAITTGRLWRRRI